MMISGLKQQSNNPWSIVAPKNRVWIVPYHQVHVCHAHRGALKRNKTEPAISQKAWNWQKPLNVEDPSPDGNVDLHRCKGFPCGQPEAQAVENYAAVHNCQCKCWVVDRVPVGAISVEHPLHAQTLV